MNYPSYRLQHYAHRQAWVQDSHPPYRHHIDTMDVADILGTGWNSPWTAWNNIRNQQIDDASNQKRFQKFQWMPTLRRLYENRCNQHVDLQWRRIRHAKHEWAFASVFGITNDSHLQQRGAVLFYLSNDQEAWGIDGSKVEKWNDNSHRCIPPNIAMEGYWSLLCADLPWADIVVAFPSWSDFVEVKVIRLYRDEDIQKGIERAISVWREHHLVHGAPPSIDESRLCSSFLMEKYRYSGDKIRRATQEEEHMLKRYHQLNDELRSLQSEQRKLRNQLFSKVAHDRGLSCTDGSRAVISRSSRGFQVRTFQAKKTA